MTSPLIIHLVYAFFAIVFLLPCVSASLYYGLFVLFRVLGYRSHYSESTGPSRRYAILIPAHNEEDVIGTTLESANQLDYPKEQYTVYVIADNCTDQTANVVRSHKNEVLERFDEVNRGKGQALAWAFNQILQLDYDAIVVLDADCTIDANALNVFEFALNQGKKVLQSHYFVGNPDESEISFAAAIGNVLEYELFYASKSSCGFSVMLVGTGMVFDKSVLCSHPWNATSLTEDAEYTVLLAKSDIPVHFVSNIRITQDASSKHSQLKVQRARWAKGTSNLAAKQAPRLIFNGLLRGKWYQVDLGITLFLVSRAFILCFVLLTVFLSLILYAVFRDSLGLLFVIMSCCSLLINFVCVFLALFFVGLTKKRLGFLLRSPITLIQMGWLSLGSFFGKEQSWSKTPR